MSEITPVATSGTVVWYAWTTAASSSTSAWTDWTTTSETAGTAWTAWTTAAGYNRAPIRILTPQQEEALRLANELRLKEEAKALAAEAKRRDEVQARAEQLFRDSLSAEQLKQYKKLKAFEVHAKNGKVYRIRTDRGVHGNIEELDSKKKVVATLCVAPKLENGWPPPPADCHLAQKLWLEHDVEGIIRAANRREVA